MRKVVYISGARADFGLMRSTLRRISEAPDLDLSIIVTGMHLSDAYGLTVSEIEGAGLPIAARVETVLQPESAANMARSIGTMVTEFTSALEYEKPDIVLLLGDRGEMLAGAIAAIHLNVTVIHIHGGERSGSIDESVRHAISKLAHVHCVATEQSRKRLIAMGEAESNVHLTGAPGLDDLSEISLPEKDELFGRFGFGLEKPMALFSYHPIVQQAGVGGYRTEQILEALFEEGWQVLALMPNSDAGSSEIREALTAEDHPDFVLEKHIPRDCFAGFLAHGDALVGNSSAGIIEAASFGIPVINVGGRQNLRERNANVVDVAPERDALIDALRYSQKNGRFPVENIYGDGKAGLRICDVLKAVEIDARMFNKIMAY
ncbi:MAG: UDP-N-acetylglucosamine 2-epimerase [Pseudomonadota bacterium]